MSVYLAHATRYKNNIPAALVIYCGRTFAGFGDLGLGNQTRTSDAEWRRKYKRQLDVAYARPGAPRRVLSEAFQALSEGRDVVLLCWCFDTLTEFQPVEYHRVKCHTEIIGRFLTQ